jgi:DNA-binding HxlR family transcriptional regulator
VDWPPLSWKPPSAKLPTGQEIPIPAAPPPKRHPYSQWAPDARALDLVGDKWTLLIIRDLVGGPRRFVELQRVLPGISTEQLRSRLNRMVADGLLTRQRYREVPPRVDYELTERARDLQRVIGELARWGFEWAWGPPRPEEAVDIGAIFRAVVGLLSFPRSVTKTVELTVDGKPYALIIEKGRVRLEERQAPEAAARVRGTERAWIEALGPEASRIDLEIEGDERVATTVLDAIPSASHRERAAA